jgi:hypothetical protein
MMADRGDRLPVVLVATLPGLAIRFGWGFLRYQARRKRGVRSFRGVLLRGGMPYGSADRLARAYHEVGSVRRLLRGVQGVRFP